MNPIEALLGGMGGVDHQDLAEKNFSLSSVFIKDGNQPPLIDTDNDETPADFANELRKLADEVERRPEAFVGVFLSAVREAEDDADSLAQTCVYKLTPFSAMGIVHQVEQFKDRAQKGCQEAMMQKCTTGSFPTPSVADHGETGQDNGGQSQDETEAPVDEVELNTDRDL